MGENKKRTKTGMGLVEKTYVGILLVVFGGIVLHAPLSVALGTIWQDHSLLIKSWKEILIILAMVLLGIILARRRQFALLKDPLLILIGVFVALHMVTATTSFVLGMTAAQVIAGLFIDLRFVVYFALVYVALLLFVEQRKNFLKVFMYGGVIVMVFALLQVFVLPADILSHIGYDSSTIEPYLTVDKNTEYIRINSTLRGPNPLGAYAVIVLGFIAAAIAKRKVPPMLQSRIVAAILVVGGCVALWVSYSRSALLAGILAVLIAVTVSLFTKKHAKIWIISGIVLLTALGGYLALHQNSTFVSNVLLHENPNGGSDYTSNDGHVDSLQDGVGRLVRQPLGAGIGSSGSASLLGNSPLIIENSYLFVSHEAGWLGLVLFITIFVMVMVRLWKGRTSYVALGVFASGVGIAAIALLLPIWADDTVSLIWWGLAAVALAGAKK